MPGAHKGQKRVSNPLELELLRDVGCHEGPGNQIREGAFWEGASALNH